MPGQQQRGGNDINRQPLLSLAICFVTIKICREPEGFRVLTFMALGQFGA